MMRIPVAVVNPREDNILEGARQNGAVDETLAEIQVREDDGIEEGIGKWSRYTKSLASRLSCPEQTDGFHERGYRGNPFL